MLLGTSHSLWPFSLTRVNHGLLTLHWPSNSQFFRSSINSLFPDHSLMTRHTISCFLENIKSFWKELRVILNAKLLSLCFTVILKNIMYTICLNSHFVVFVPRPWLVILRSGLSYTKVYFYIMLSWISQPGELWKFVNYW